ncbi:MAG: hypothetical protein MJA83_06245 [Gammaproteobacteria bacterium]|nr:hypothetical protein [Gammaproteobacteria bacterium]
MRKERLMGNTEQRTIAAVLAVLLLSFQLVVIDHVHSDSHEAEEACEVCAQFGRYSTPLAKTSFPAGLQGGLPLFTFETVIPEEQAVAYFNSRAPPLI